MIVVQILVQAFLAGFICKLDHILGNLLCRRGKFQGSGRCLQRAGEGYRRFGRICSLYISYKLHFTIVSVENKTWVVGF
jgi:hypothetical protein